MPDNVVRALRFREGGHVERCHVIPHQGSYSVGSHSWQAATLLLVLHPDPSIALLKAVLLHDVQERWVGDLPIPSGEVFLDLKKEYETAENRILDALEIDLGHSLTHKDYVWLKAVDRVELLLWCLDQEALGNRHVVRVHENIERCLKGMTLPQEMIDFLSQFKWQRTTDFIT
jgi:5'-deoxynucleotidase YfbR-like HD superfamily hydrolase